MTLSDQRRRDGGAIAAVLPDRGVTLTYEQVDDRSMQLARRLRAHGLRPGDHLAVLLDDDHRWFEAYWAAIRSGLYITPVPWHLDASEVGRVIEDCGATALVTTGRLAELVRAIGARRLANVTLRLVADGDLPGWSCYEDALAGQLAQPLDVELEGAAMFYTAGTTGPPKGVLPPLTGAAYGSRPNPLAALLQAQLGFDGDTTLLCPLPMYHSAPVGLAGAVHRLGGTVVVPGGFDARSCLELVEHHRVTHLQLAPIHLVRLLELDAAERGRFDLSSLRVVLHAGTSCPVEVKRQALAWLGPIVHEYYIGAEANGLTIIGPDEWLARPGTVGRPLAGAIRIVDQRGDERPPGELGQVWFDSGAQFEYHGAPELTAAAFDSRGWSTLGDVGAVDADGYLYLAGRACEVLTVGGAAVHPQEVEDLLLAHPAVADVAVVGPPVQALVQVVAGVIPGPALAGALLDRCRAALSAPSVPESIEFVADVGRLPTGKLPRR